MRFDDSDRLAGHVNLRDVAERVFLAADRHEWSVGGEPSAGHDAADAGSIGTVLTELR